MIKLFLFIAMAILCCAFMAVFFMAVSRADTAMERVLSQRRKSVGNTTKNSH